MSTKVKNYFAKTLLATFLVLASFVLVPRIGWARPALDPDAYGLNDRKSGAAHSERNGSGVVQVRVENGERPSKIAGAAFRCGKLDEL